MIEQSTHEEREVRAARNQALFRVLNEKLKALNESFVSVTKTFTVACECADRNCIEMIELDPSEYLEVRSEPRHFVVLSAHVYPEVEHVVAEAGRYVVVEKTGTSGEVAEILDEASQAG